MKKYSEYFQKIEDTLEKDDFEEVFVYEVTFDDDGNCIHVTIGGDVELATIRRLGNLFNDENPMVCAEKSRLKIVIVNSLND